MGSLKSVMRGAIAPLLLMIFAGTAWTADGIVTIDSIPRGARVEQAGKELGATPLQLTFPKTYFQAPSTVWGRYLAAPLKLTLSAPGHKGKQVELGDGPYNWTSLNGMNRFTFYLLQPRYIITLEKEGGDSPGDTLALAAALEKLADLKDKGVLTEEEFQSQKQKLLGATAPVSGPPREALKPDASTHPVEFCRRLWENANTMATADRYHRIDDTGELLVPGAAGPTVHCLWLSPSRDIASLKVNVQCGISSTEETCKSFQVEDTLEIGREVRCLGLGSGNDWVMVTESGCVVQTGAQGHSSSAERAFITQVLSSVASAMASPLEGSKQP